jgi:hypothetical protein
MLAMVQTRSGLGWQCLFLALPWGLWGENREETDDQTTRIAIRQRVRCSPPRQPVATTRR